MIQFDEHKSWFLDLNEKESVSKATFIMSANTSSCLDRGVQQGQRQAVAVTLVSWRVLDILEEGGG